MLFSVYHRFHFSMLSTVHKFLLSIFIFLIAFGSQLDFRDNDILVNKTASFDIALKKCFEKISDFLEYPQVSRVYGLLTIN